MRDSDPDITTASEAGGAKSVHRVVTNLSGYSISSSEICNTRAIFSAVLGVVWPPFSIRLTWPTLMPAFSATIFWVSRYFNLAFLIGVIFGVMSFTTARAFSCPALYTVGNCCPTSKRLSRSSRGLMPIKSMRYRTIPPPRKFFRGKCLHRVESCI